MRSPLLDRRGKAHLPPLKLTKYNLRLLDSISGSSSLPRNARIIAQIPADIKQKCRMIIESKAKDEANRTAEDISVNQISERLRVDCETMVTHASGERAFVPILYTALEDLVDDTIITLSEKADWNVADFPAIIGTNLKRKNSSGSSSDPVRKRSRKPSKAELTESETYLPPSTIRAAPRPDITLGIKMDAIVAELTKKGYDQVEVKTFLQNIHKVLAPRKSDGKIEPVLIPMPTAQAPGLCFPFLVVETMGYCHRRQLFETENQVPGTGACALHLQEKLAELETPDARASPGYHPRFFFSIVTEGPVLELWVHWTETEQQARTYNSGMLGIAHGCIEDSILKFMTIISNICKWGQGPYLDWVVAQIEILVKRDLLPTIDNVKNDLQPTIGNVKNNSRPTFNNIKNDSRASIHNVKDDLRPIINNVKNGLRPTIDNIKNDLRPPIDNVPLAGCSRHQ